MNPFAFVRAVRDIYDGPVVLAGGISDGQALRAALALGADLAYMGTKFIATRESLASEGYKEMLVDSTIDDILLTKALTGLETSMLKPSLINAGLDVTKLNEQIDPADAKRMYEGASGLKRWQDIWSAGHSVSGVKEIPSVAELVDQTRKEYDQ